MQSEKKIMLLIATSKSSAATKCHLYYLEINSTKENRDGYARNRVGKKFLLMAWRYFAAASSREYHTGDKTDTAVYLLNKHVFLQLHVNTVKGPKEEL